MKTQLIVTLSLLLIASGCASLNSVSLTQVPEDRTKPIEASASSWGPLGLYGNNNFADEAIQKLKEQCPNGKISGVYTKYDGAFYLLWTTRTITAHAFCGKAV